MKRGVGLLNSIWRHVGTVCRATIRIAGGGPFKGLLLRESPYCQVVRQAGVPLASSNFSRRKIRGGLSEGDAVFV
jgi:hypothetical protein